MNKLKDILITDFKDTGDNEIDIEKTIKNWDMYCKIYYSMDNYRLVRETHKSTRTTFKTNISKKQAEILIERLKLVKYDPGIFRNNFIYLDKRLLEKYDPLCEELKDMEKRGY